MFQFGSHTGKKNDFLLDHVIFAMIMLFYIRFVSDGHSVCDSLTFVSHWTLASCRTDVEMCSVTVMRNETDSVTVMRNVIEVCKRSKPVLHSFHIRSTFVLRWIFAFKFLNCSYMGILMINCLTMSFLQ